MAQALSACSLCDSIKEKLVSPLPLEGDGGGFFYPMTNSKGKGGTVSMRILCAALFLCFTFLFLYSYQADVLAVFQHLVSGGRTHYNSLVGAVLITFVLWLLQVGVFAIARVTGRAHFMTYIPSLLLLAFITDVDVNIAEGYSMGWWMLFLPLGLVVAGVLMWYGKQLEPYEPETPTKGLLSRVTWINVAMLSVMFFFVGMCSNHNDVFHYRASAECALADSSYNKALAVGKDAQATDSSLTMIRIYALAMKGELGERLFEYPIVGGADAMFPNRRSTMFMLYGEDRFYHSLGGHFVQRMNPERYCNFVLKYGMQTPATRDYLLTYYLLKKDLGKFAKTLAKYYDMKNLPKHYKEALVLYNHTTSTPVIKYVNDVMEADYQDFQSIRKQYPHHKEQLFYAHQTYGKTYWYYYKASPIPLR